MKQSLQLKMGQSLTMTPQLQQAIRLLQLSTLDLQQEIQEALESNPMLEQASDNDERTEPPEPAAQADAGEANTEQDDSWTEQISADLPVDSNWEDIYPSTDFGPSSGGGGEDRDFLFENQSGASESLQEQLNWQLNLSNLSDLDRVIGIALIDAIDEDGFLGTDVEEIASGFSDMDVETDEVVAVLKLIQSFDPPGVGARDMQECLALQLRSLPEDTPHIATARTLVCDHMEALGGRDYTRIMQKLKISEPELLEIMDLIRSLSPRPGGQVSDQRTDYIVPDVIVRKVKNRWQVELNPETAPKLRINTRYENMIRRGDSSPDNQFMRNNLQEARWFLKSLQSRSETLLKVATRIVEHQQGFLEYGEEAMKPLVLHDIAEDVEMHESTISRVTTQKYMLTPKGIFELKYFFSSHVSTVGGGECSSTAIRAIIRKIIAEENPRKPLSDSKIAALLTDQGIQVARRTIAKYRESLAIPPSNERRQLV